MAPFVSYVVAFKTVGVIITWQQTISDVMDIVSLIVMHQIFTFFALENIPLTSSVIIGLSSSANITTHSSNYSTYTHQTILNPTSVTYTTSMNEQTGLRSSTISSLVFSKGTYIS